MRQRGHRPAECLGTVRIYAFKSSSRVALRGPGFCLQEHLSHKARTAYQYRQGHV